MEVRKFGEHSFAVLPTADVNLHYVEDLHQSIHLVGCQAARWSLRIWLETEIFAFMTNCCSAAPIAGPGNVRKVFFLSVSSFVNAKKLAKKNCK